MPKGERPPPFLPPPTSIGCGGESYGDNSHIRRVMRRFTDVVEKIAKRATWCIECLGYEHELDVRYQTAMEVVSRSNNVNIAVLMEARAAAIKRLDRIERKFFSGDAKQDSLELFVAGGWIGSQNPKTLKILDSVRNELLKIYVDLRSRLDMPPPDWSVYVASVDVLVEAQLEQLFTISGADEVTWFEAICEIADAARVIKARAAEMSNSFAMD